MVQIESTMEKIARILTKNSGVEILMGPNFCTDCKGKIWIPPIPDQADPKIRSKTETGILHEIGHNLWTDIDKSPKEPQLHNIHNFLEDVRIERLNMEKWPGMEAKQKSFLTDMTDELNKRFSQQDMPILKRIMDLTYLRGTEQRIGDLNLIVPQEVEDIWQEKVGDLINQIAESRSFDKTLKLSKELYERLKDKQPPEQPDKKQSSEGQSGEGQPNKGDNNEGKNDNSKGSPSGTPKDSEKNKGDKSGDTDREKGSDSPSGRADGDLSSGDDSKSNKGGSEKPISGKDKKDGESAKAPDDPLKSIRNRLANEADSNKKINTINDDLEKEIDQFADKNKLYRVDKNLKETVYKRRMESDWVTTINKYAQEGRRMTAYSSSRFRSLFISEKVQRWFRGTRSGKLDTRKLWNDDSDNIFKRKSKTTYEDSAVSIVIDNSSSMRSRGKNDIASALLVSLATELDRVRVPFECMGFTSNNNCSSLNDSGIRTQPIIINQVKTFNEPFRRVKHRFVWPEKSMLTVELPCIEIAAKRLAMRRETKKVLFVLCDGDIQSGNRILNRSLHHAQIEYVKRLERAGFHVIGFGIQDEGVKYYYSNHIIINDLDTFAKTFFRQLSKVLIGG